MPTITFTPCNNVNTPQRLHNLNNPAQHFLLQNTSGTPLSHDYEHGIKTELFITGINR